MLKKFSGCKQAHIISQEQSYFFNMQETKLFTLTSSCCLIRGARQSYLPLMPDNQPSATQHHIHSVWNFTELVFITDDDDFWLFSRQN